MPLAVPVLRVLPGQPSRRSRTFRKGFFEPRSGGLCLQTPAASGSSGVPGNGIPDRHLTMESSSRRLFEE